MKNNMRATKVALTVTRPGERLWFLRMASQRCTFIGLGTFCREVGATADELGTLLLERVRERERTA